MFHLIVTKSMGLLAYVVFCFIRLPFGSSVDASCCRKPDIQTLDCSHCNFEEIPNLQDPNITSLYLNNNQIRHIRDDAFSNLTSLELLSLKFNPLVLVRDHSFAGLENLHTLDLYQKEGGTISERTFEPLTALKMLKLGNLCGSPDRGCVFPYKLFPFLSPALVRLELSVPYSFVFGDHFAHLQNLATLILNGKDCSIYHITKETFAVFAKNLKTLQVYHCRVHSLQPNFLNGFEKLETLNLACNSELNLTQVFSAVKDMPYPTLKTLIVDGAHKIEFNEIGPRWFNSTRFHNLERLSVRLTDIVSADFEFLFYLPNLQYFNAGYNTILRPVYPHNVTKLISFAANHNLIGVDLAYLGLPFKSHHIFEERHCHRHFVYSEDFFRKPPPSIETPESTWMSNTPHHMFVPADDEREDRPDIIFRKNIPPSLLYVYINNIAFAHLPTDAKNRSVNADNNILFFDLSGVKIDRMDGLIYGFEKLQGLDVSDCSLSFINPAFLDSLPALRYLNFGKNELNGIPLERLFRHASRLEILDIRHNRLKDIPENIFANMNSLRSIFLQGNSLGKVNFSIRNNPNLTLIDLRHNSLIMTGKFMRELDDFYTKYNNGLVVKLFGNVFQCDCNSLDFLKWLRRTKVNIIDKADLQCDYKLDNKRYFMSVADIDELDYYCNRMKIVAMSVTPFVTMALVLLLIILMHRYRWTLKWRFYLLRRRLLHYRNLKWRRDGHAQGVDVALIQHATDAFVSYNHSEDYLWIQNDLVPKVEDEWGFRLLIGQRDFLAGVPIAENICNAIDSSRHVILVITPAFAASEWCDFEMHMALVKGRRHLIIIYKEEVDLDDMSRTMRAILSSVNYIEYSETQVGNELFWKRLKTSLTNNNGGHVERVNT